MRDSGFGRSFSDLWAVLALLALASAVALALDRPGRARRSGEALLAIVGAAGCAAAALAFPGLAGHPATTSPVGLMLALDWAHLAAASIWIGGLARPARARRRDASAGKRVAALAVVVPRFSRAAMASVAVLLATGIVASIVHLPTLASLWETNYGLALIAKSVLLACALVLGAVNNLRSRPRLVAAAQRRDQALGEGAARLLRRLVLGESALLAGAVAAAAILTSLAPPSSALAKLGKTDAHVGPGRRRARPSRATACASRSASSPTAPPSTTPSRCACSAPASPCATRGHRPARHARHEHAAAGLHARRGRRRASTSAAGRRS